MIIFWWLTIDDKLLSDWSRNFAYLHLQLINVLWNSLYVYVHVQPLMNILAICCIQNFSRIPLTSSWQRYVLLRWVAITFTAPEKRILWRFSPPTLRYTFSRLVDTCFATHEIEMKMLRSIGRLENMRHNSNPTKCIISSCTSSFPNKRCHLPRDEEWGYSENWTRQHRIT